MSASYRIFKDSLQERFGNGRKKVQIFGGGFANGKTAAACALKALPIARDYPGANILIARSTYPKLNDTIRKEFLKWCPPHWIKSFPRSNNGSNTCTLINKTEISFRYIQQQGKGGEASTSNLLSATYDLIIVDQMEDPEIVEKDFDDLLGRLRGNAEYIGDDPTMPKTGPRWLILTLNPTRNWCYRKLIKPLHTFQKHGVITDNLLCRRELETHKPILDDEGKPELLIELHEGSTYENKENLGEDFIQMLESSYRGQMRDRFLMGLWSAYEGLIYPQFDENVHGVSIAKMEEYLDELRAERMAVESCFMVGFVDPFGNAHVLDGYYIKEYPIPEQIKHIKELYEKYDIPSEVKPMADPAIFRRSPGSGQLVGRTVADMFWNKSLGIQMKRGNNAILNGIAKVGQYLQPTTMHINPYTKNHGAPHFYINEDLLWFNDEINEYVWNTNTTTTKKEDKPRDGNDHAMDTVKYMFSRIAQESKKAMQRKKNIPVHMQWHEEPDAA
jgi:hypothetical protein